MLVLVQGEGSGSDDSSSDADSAAEAAAAAAEGSFAERLVDNARFEVEGLAVVAHYAHRRRATRAETQALRALPLKTLRARVKAAGVESSRRREAERSPKPAAALAALLLAHESELARGAAAFRMRNFRWARDPAIAPPPENRPRERWQGPVLLAPAGEVAITARRFWVPARTLANTIAR